MKLTDETWNLCEKYRIQQKREEYSWLIEHIKEDSDILEIGCYDGGTTVGFCLSNGLVLSCDLNVRYDLETLKKDTGKENIFCINGNSRNIKTQITEICNSFDVIFIDGDHSYEGAKADYELYKDLIKEGGIIAFHDIADSDFHRKHGCLVSKLWKELKLSPNLKTDEILVDDKVWGGIGIVYA